MAACEVRTAFRHSIPGGYFSRAEVSLVDTSCELPAAFRISVRGMEHGNHREGAEVVEVGVCEHHLNAFRQIDERLHALGWSRALTGPPMVIE